MLSHLFVAFHMDLTVKNDVTNWRTKKNAVQYILHITWRYNQPSPCTHTWNEKVHGKYCCYYIYSCLYWCFDTRFLCITVTTNSFLSSQGETNKLTPYSSKEGIFEDLLHNSVQRRMKGVFDTYKWMCKNWSGFSQWYALHSYYSIRFPRSQLWVNE